MRVTRFVSRAASRSMGRMKRKKKTERMAKPLAARVCISVRRIDPDTRGASDSSGLPRHRDQLRKLQARTILLLDPSEQ